MMILIQPCPLMALVVTTSLVEIAETVMKLSTFALLNRRSLPVTSPNLQTLAGNGGVHFHYGPPLLLDDRMLGFNHLKLVQIHQGQFCNLGIQIGPPIQRILIAEH